ncbi:MAG: protein-L-isoaspartate O-methyltransferase [Siculibacillus sp.]
MADFAIQRRTMVDNQIRTVDVTDHAVIAAFLTVGREAFVPAAMRSLAYIDRPTELGGGRAVMQPAPLAKLIQLAAVVPGEKVLLIGGNTGYAAAILAELGAVVTMVEERADLAETAATELGAKATVVVGPLAAGAPVGAPYDLVLFDGAIEVLPEAITAQVADGGRIVAIEGAGLSGRAVVTVRSSGKMSSRAAFNLPGRILPGLEQVRAFAL